MPNSVLLLFAQFLANKVMLKILPSWLQQYELNFQMQSRFRKNGGTTDQMVTSTESLETEELKSICFTSDCTKVAELWITTSAGKI